MHIVMDDHEENKESSPDQVSQTIYLCVNRGIVLLHIDIYYPPFWYDFVTFSHYLVAIVFSIQYI